MQILAAQGLQPEALPQVSTEVGSHDGSYFISKRGGEWEFYYQERGSPWASDLRRPDRGAAVPHQPLHPRLAR
jgi:hypothetical protein